MAKGIISSKGQSESGVEYTRLICDEEEDETFLAALADKAKLDSGKLKLICTERIPEDQGWPVDQVTFCYDDS